MAARAPRLTGGVLAVAAAFTLGGAATARAVGDADAARHRSAAQRSANRATQSFAASLDAVRAAVGTLTPLGPQIAAAPMTPPLAVSSLLSKTGVAGVALVPVAGEAALVAGVLPDAVTLAALRASLGPAMDLARDTADPHAGAVSHGVGIVVPVYRTATFSTEQRRTALSAYVVALVDPAALLTRVAAPGDMVVMRVGGVPVTAVVPRSKTSAETTVDLAGQPWQLVIAPNVVTRAGSFSWPVFLIALLGAIGVLAVGWRAARALYSAAVATEALERETRTVAEIGPLLQQSLDLAEVLPAVAVRLSDEFGLDSFAVELIGEHGELVDVFAVGRRNREAGEPAIVGSVGIVAGAEVAMPLLRGGRTIGRLRLVSREDLAPTQVDALRGAADLIAVATYNVELYEREQGTVRRLQELDKLKDAFLGTISHELRTPITAISGFARMLNERWHDLSEEQRRDFLRRVGRNSTSLGLLVDDLLDFARLERQALSTSVAPLQLDAVVASFVAQVVPALGDHAVEMHLADNVMALADPRAIERVLANLLTNAAKFSPAGSPVEVTLEPTNGWAILKVADHGPGIAEEDRLRVFTRFYRGQSDVARATRGAGIGLAVVHELVTQMGGEIEVEGRDPHGTVLVVRLPIAVGPPEPRPSTDGRVPARSTP